MGYGKIIASDGHEIELNIELHPGEVLADELHARKITKSVFAKEIGLYPGHLSEILKGKRNITASIAVRLEKAFVGLSAEFWLDLQMKYDLYQVRHKMPATA